MTIQDKSSWQDAKKKINFPQLKENINVDVAIIGGGITGITSAYLLAKAGKKVALFEAKDALATETTMFTTAFITKSIDTGLTELTKMFDAKSAKMVWESGQAAIEEIERIVKAEKIDCDFKRVSYFAYANNTDEFTDLEEEYKTSQKLGLETVLKKSNNLGFKNFGTLELKNQAKFHPIKYTDALAQKAIDNGAMIFTNTEITGFSGSKNITLKTKDFSVKAQQVIVATYKPLKVLKTFAKKGMYQSSVFEVKIPAGKIKEALYVDAQNPYHYIRIDKDQGFDRMIIGGEDHRAEAKMNESKNYKALQDYLTEIIGDDFQISKKWNGLILEPSDGLALIGESKPNQFVATAFSGNGMTYSTIAAMIFRDSITGKKNAWIKLYDPTRSMKIGTFGRKAIDYTEEAYGGYIKNNLKYHGKQKLK